MSFARILPHSPWITPSWSSTMPVLLLPFSRITSGRFANLLTPLVLDTDASEWGGRNFTLNKWRKGWLDLVCHYNGSSESERRNSAARHELRNLFYKNEMAFNFETFSTNTKAKFDTMEKYGEGRSEQEKVSTLLENTRTTNHKLESTITFFRSNHNRNYPTTTNYLATQISFIFPEQQRSQRINLDSNKRNVSRVKKDKWWNTKSCNGVDISDTTRFFLSEEWRKIIIILVF